MKTDPTNDPAAFAWHITGQVHDDWLDLDEIEFDKPMGELRIALRTRASGPPEKILSILTVKEVVIKDTERVGWYDINTVRIDLMHNCIEIRCGVPLAIDVFVGDPFKMFVLPFTDR